MSQKSRGANRKKNSSSKGSTALLALLFLIGVVLLVYPSFANYWNSFTQSRAIASYAETVASYDIEAYRQIWEAALDYNHRLAEEGTSWILTDEQRAEYESLLNIGGTGNMGFIDIPKINVNLPIYHGTSESVLQTSIGHIESSSLPVGSAYEDDDIQSGALFASHCVVSGHRGLPSAKLFSELDKLVEGDIFIMTILDQTLTYEIDQIRIVEPTDVSELVLEEGKDYCTLVTCTPYGINTHRMLVRGHRIENEKKIDIRIMADALQIDPIFVAPVIAVPIIVILLLWMMFMTSGSRRRED